MKIISGSLKGRKIDGYDIVGTRPTMDRVKESLFGMIQNNVKNKVVLDLFAGSGSLGLEAISNGAKMCYFNDINKKCILNIRKMMDEFKINDRVILMNLDYNKALENFKYNDISFDVIFLDPPYNNKDINNIIMYIKDNNLLNLHGIIVCEVDDLYLNVDCYDNIKEKKYGNKYIVIYKYEK